MKAFSYWLCALILVCLSVPAMAADATGDWHGLLKTPSQTLRVAVHIERQGTTLVGHVESPDQGPQKLPLAGVENDGDTLNFEVPAINASYSGRWVADKMQWSGEWSQGNGKAKLDLLPGDPPASVKVEGLDGSWEGALDVGTAKLRLVLHVSTGRFGTTASLDSPDQVVSGIPVSAISRSGSDVAFEVAAVGGQFKGRLSSDGSSLQGEWRQGPQPMPLTLIRKDEARKVSKARPQHPVKPYPYAEEDVAYTNVLAGVRLAGSLTLPNGYGPHPAVVLISGSGGQDRDETLAGHKPFLVLADHLTRHGIAVLRFDDRGVGGSTGDPRNATTADFATDVEAGVAYLRTRTDIDGRRIGLIGHSEGGLIAPMVAVDDEQLALIVLLAAPAGLGEDMLLAQQRTIGLSLGQTTAEIDAQVPLMRRIIAAVRGASNQKEAEAAARTVIAALPLDQRPAPLVADALITRLSSNWMRFFLTYDPRATLTRVRVPILALNGSKDLQVSAFENLAEIRTTTASNPDVVTIELPGLNHLFQTAPTGAMGEYADIEETFAPVALVTITEWLQPRMKKAP